MSFAKTTNGHVSSVAAPAYSMNLPPNQGVVMTRLPTPLSEIDQRVPEAGRIRLGIRSGKAMKSLDTFRFTSPHQDVITQLAGLYGGEARPWSDPKASPSNQFEVITTAKEIDVYLPSNALSVWYELWAGGGVQRRCDGESCQVPVTTPGGWEMSTTPCICLNRQLMECRPYTRMNVIIPSIPFRGVWRLETKGWNAAKELPGMVSIIDTMTNQGRLVQARLHIERRMQMTPNGKRNFVVPGVTLAHTAQDMILGAADVQALTSGPRISAPMTALGSGVVGSPDPNAAEIVDAEIIDPELEQLEDRIHEIAAQQRINPDRLWQGILLVIAPTGGDIDSAAKDRIRNAIARLEAGTLNVLGFNADGTVIWKR